MSLSFQRILYNHQGVAAVEFALLVPLMMVVMVIILELGMAMHQENMLKKHVAAGANLAAHATYPLTNDTQTRVSNMVRTGSVDGGNNLLAGWAEAESDLQITTLTYNLNGETVPYVRVTASVPYIPMMQSLLSFLDLEDFSISASHEAVFIP